MYFHGLGGGGGGGGDDDDSDDNDVLLGLNLRAYSRAVLLLCAQSWDVPTAALAHPFLDGHKAIWLLPTQGKCKREAISELLLGGNAQ